MKVDRNVAPFILINTGRTAMVNFMLQLTDKKGKSPWYPLKQRLGGHQN
jgi:hypothetical protein